MLPIYLIGNACFKDGIAHCATYDTKNPSNTQIPFHHLRAEQGPCILSAIDILIMFVGIAALALIAKASILGNPIPTELYGSVGAAGGVVALYLGVFLANRIFKLDLCFGQCSKENER